MFAYIVSQPLNSIFSFTIDCLVLFSFRTQVAHSPQIKSLFIQDSTCIRIIQYHQESKIGRDVDSLVYINIYSLYTAKTLLLDNII